MPPPLLRAHQAPVYLPQRRFGLADGVALEGQQRRQRDDSVLVEAEVEQLPDKPGAVVLPATATGADGVDHVGDV